MALGWGLPPWWEGSEGTGEALRVFPGGSHQAALFPHHQRLLRGPCRVLSTNTCLEELDLSFSPGLHDASVELLCQGLQHCARPLQTLR